MHRPINNGEAPMEQPDLGHCTVQCKGPILLWLHNDRCGGEVLLECLKGLLVHPFPAEGYSLAHELSDLGKSLNESSIVVGQPKEAAHLLSQPWWPHVLYSSNFGSVWLEAFLHQEVPKEQQLLSEEDALAWLQVHPSLPETVKDSL